MNWELIINTVIGGGIVLSLSGVIYLRITSQLDKLDEAVSGILVAVGKLSDRVQRLDRIEDKVSSSENRLTGLETLAKLGNH